MLYQHGRPYDWHGCEICGLDTRLKDGQTINSHSISSRRHLSDIYQSAARGCQICVMLQAGMETYHGTCEIPISEFHHPRIELEVKQPFDPSQKAAVVLKFGYGRLDFSDCAWREVEFYSVNGRSQGLVRFLEAATADRLPLRSWRATLGSTAQESARLL